MWRPLCHSVGGLVTPRRQCITWFGWIGYFSSD